jgi:hypothetical protein
MENIKFPAYVPVDGVPHLLLNRTVDNRTVVNDEGLIYDVSMKHMANEIYTEGYPLTSRLLNEMEFSKISGIESEIVWYKDEEDYLKNRFYLIESFENIFTLMPISTSFKFIHELQEEYFKISGQYLFHPFFERLNQIFRNQNVI